MTLQQMLLIAADSLERDGIDPFTAADLAVRAFGLYPGAFSLEGFEGKYVDNNKAMAALSGEAGLVRRGLLERPAAKMYRLTKAGKTLAEQLAKAKPTNGHHGGNGHMRLTMEQMALLRHVLSSAALDKFRQNLQTEITFAEASVFWGIEHCQASEVRDVMRQFSTALGHVADVLRDDGCVMRDGRHVGLDDLLMVRKVSEYLEVKFWRQLRVLGSRKVNV